MLYPAGIHNRTTLIYSLQWYYNLFGTTTKYSDMITQKVITDKEYL